MSDIARTLPASRGRSASWEGHHPITSAALQRIPPHSAAYFDQAPLRERVLLSICEFRVAIAHIDFGDRLRSGAPAKLALARFALNEVGAMQLAAKVSAAIQSLRGTCSPQRRVAVLRKLQQDLLAAGSALDELILQYARASLRNER